MKMIQFKKCGQKFAYGRRCGRPTGHKGRHAVRAYLWEVWK